MKKVYFLDPVLFCFVFLDKVPFVYFKWKQSVFFSPGNCWHFLFVKLSFDKILRCIMNTHYLLLWTKKFLTPLEMIFDFSFLSKLIEKKFPLVAVHIEKKIVYHICSIIKTSFKISMVWNNEEFGNWEMGKFNWHLIVFKFTKTRKSYQNVIESKRILVCLGTQKHYFLNKSAGFVLIQWIVKTVFFANI